MPERKHGNLKLQSYIGGGGKLGFVCRVNQVLCCSHGPGIVVVIATGYRLDSPGIESRWGARFSAPVQTGPGAHPASCTMGTGSFPGVESTGA